MNYRFSLIIPIAPWRNPEILKSIDKLDYLKKDFEVIVEKGKNPSKNRNNGIKKSKGEILIFLDDDATINKDYLNKIEDFFKEYKEIDIVGGPQLTPKEDNFFAKISGIVLTSNFGAFKVNKRYKKGKIVLDVDETSLTSANLCIKKEVFNKIKGFDVSLYPGEDPELLDRAKKTGLKLAYNPEIIIYHKRRSNFSSFCKQIFKYGFVRPKKNKISKGTPLLFIIPMVFTIYFMFIPLLTLINFLFFIPFFAYVFLALIFSFYDSMSNRTLIGFFILPFLYLFTHLSYGIGMLAGYFDSKKDTLPHSK